MLSLPPSFFKKKKKGGGEKHASSNFSFSYSLLNPTGRLLPKTYYTPVLVSGTSVRCKDGAAELAACVYLVEVWVVCVRACARVLIPNRACPTPVSFRVKQPRVELMVAFEISIEISTVAIRWLGRTSGTRNPGAGWQLGRRSLLRSRRLLTSASRRAERLLCLTFIFAVCNGSSLYKTGSCQPQEALRYHWVSIAG